MDVKVPQLAEGVETGTVVNVLVREGDEVKKEQALIEIETSKAVAPIPSPVAGKVIKVYVKAGEEVSVGRAVVSISGNGVDAAPVTKPAVQKATSSVTEKIVPQKIIETISSSAVELEPPLRKSAFPPPASPSVRKLAQQLGIDLNRVQGSEHGGRITLDDLKAYVARIQQLAFQKKEGSASPASPKKAVSPAIDFSKWGPVNRKKLSSLRRTIGERMQENWATIPHVTQFDDADITDLMDLRKKYAAAYEKKKGKLTVTAFAIKAVVAALKKYPVANSSLDESTGELVYKDYYHIGIAVDTEQGLIVPVIRNADKKSLLEISIELNELAEKTRSRKVTLDELQGSSFTISNLGGIGGSYFSPIVNKPEVAILGIGRGREQFIPAGKSREMELRLLLPVALSYDHRVIDGADGARFIRAFIENLEQLSEKEIAI